PSEQDKKKIIDQGPWTIMGSHLILKEWALGQRLEELQMNMTEMWVIIKGLPLNLLTREAAKMIGDRAFGGTNHVDMNPTTPINLKGYLRIKVPVDVSKPLVPGFSWRRAGKKDIFISFQYERLSDFYYSCGKLGHLQIACKGDQLENTYRYEP